MDTNQLPAIHNPRMDNSQRQCRNPHCVMCLRRRILLFAMCLKRHKVQGAPLSSDLCRLLMSHAHAVFRQQFVFYTTPISNKRHLRMQRMRMRPKRGGLRPSFVEHGRVDREWTDEQEEIFRTCRLPLFSDCALPAVFDERLWPGWAREPALANT